MLIVMKSDATTEQVDSVCKAVEELGYRPHSLPGSLRTAIGVTGNEGAVEATSLEEMPGD